MDFAKGLVIGMVGMAIIMYCKEDEIHDLIDFGCKKGKKMFKKYKYMLG